MRGRTGSLYAELEAAANEPIRVFDLTGETADEIKQRAVEDGAPQFVIVPKDTMAATLRQALLGLQFIV